MPDVILLHNTLSSKAIYASLTLPEHRVFALDFRAHGERMHETTDVTASTLAADVLAFADAQGLDRFTVGGSSIGATVALLVAERSPLRVERLVLCGVNFERASLLERVRYDAILAVLARTGPTKIFLDQAVALLFSTATSAAVRSEWRDRIAKHDRQAMLAAMRCWRNRPHLLERARRITTPTMILAGADDRSCPPAHGRRLQAVMPCATLALVGGAGHMLPLERPDVFSAAIRGTTSPASDVR